ncbi:DNA-directed RNA polymerases I, II, and III subunit RPABC3 [Nematocida sp. AWRm77]|nr:DNA-directed RNA polymerases I, II, and III subunit RPABC3 [Nematocida sp. AWRm77]
MKLFSEVFTLSEIDPDGKMFDEVSRVLFKSGSTTVYLDYYAPVMKYKKMDKVEIALFSNENGFSEKSIPEKYEYLMGGGVVYKKEDTPTGQQVEISFSGMLALFSLSKPVIKETDTYSKLFIGVSPA